MMTEATVNPFFSVDRVPVYADYNGEKLDTKKSAIINQDDGSVYGLVTPKYKIVTNEEVASVFEEALDGYNIIETKDMLNNDGSKWYRDIVFGKEYDKEVQVGDVVKTKIRIKNSYDGKASVGYEFGSLRLICTNGMTSFRKEGKVNIRHFSNNIVDNIKQSIEGGLINFLEEMEIYKQFAEIPYSNLKFEQFILNEVKTDDKEDKGLLTKKQSEKLIDLVPIIRRQYGDTDQNKWNQLNALTAFQTHHTKGHKGSSEFSAAYNNIQQLINRFVVS